MGIGPRTYIHTHTLSMSLATVLVDNLSTLRLTSHFVVTLPFRLNIHVYKLKQNWI